jgi:hypothetical protein
MTDTHKITMENSTLLAWKGKIRGGAHSVAVEMATELSTGVADAINARWVLFDKNSMPKQFHKVELETEMRNVRVKFSIKGLEQFDLVCEPDMLTKFVVKRKGDGKKKAKVLLLTFHCHYKGNLHSLLDTFEQLGSGKGVLTIEKLQSELPFAAENTEPLPKPPRQPGRKKHVIVQ